MRKLHLLFIVLLSRLKKFAFADYAIDAAASESVEFADDPLFISSDGSSDAQIRGFGLARQARSESREDQKQEQSSTTVTSSPKINELMNTRGMTEAPSNRKKHGGASSETWVDGIRIRKINKAPLDIIMEDPDLTILAKALTMSKTAGNDDLRAIAATVFAPVDSAFQSLPIDFTDSNTLEFPNRTEYGKNIFEYHIVAPRLVAPAMIPSEGFYTAKTRFTNHDLVLQRYNRSSTLGDVTLIINGYAEVKEIIQARRGWIYKIDAVLGPKWNDGPTLMDFVRTTPWLSRTRYLLEAASLFNPKLESLGPITVFLIPDSGWRLNGFDLPDCVFRALARKEHRPLLRNILKWLTLPGLWTAKDITEVNHLPNGAPPKLRVAHASLGYSTSRRGLYKMDLPVPPPPGPIPSFSMDGPNDGDSDIHERRRLTFVEDREIVKWSIPLYNGWVHVLSELPPMSQFEAVLALWDCVHEFCLECPKVSGDVLQFFDEGGLLPTTRPLEYIVPSGPRPPWVCQGSSTWFPPGWDPKSWQKFTDHAKKGQPRAAKESQKGSVAAAQKMTELRYKLDDARIKLKRIKTRSDLNTQHLRPLWDPKALVSFVTARHVFTGMPDCQEQDDHAKLTMNDMKYLSRWM